MTTRLIKLGDAIRIARLRNRTKADTDRSRERYRLKSGGGYSDILMPVTPGHADAIRNGIVAYEFRKTRPALPVGRVWLYETEPVCAVRTVVDVEEILILPKNDAFHRYGYAAALPKTAFKADFEDCRDVVVYRLGSQTQIDPATLSDLGLKCAPRTFFYLTEAGEFSPETQRRDINGS